jgi:uncharacterized protein YjiS (DUF1127 family)
MHPPHHIEIGKDEKMAYYTETPVKFGFFRRFSLFQALIRADRAYRERQHLLSLSDEMLDDVGLKRSDLQL